MDKKKLLIGASIIVAGWVGYSHMYGAYNKALQEAEYSSTGTSWNSGNAESRAKQHGYLRYCELTKQAKIIAFVEGKKNEINNRYREKENSVQGLSLFNSILGQSFGDSAYQNYIDKYGTNPFDALTGGALSKAPGTLGKIVSSNKQEELTKLTSLQQNLLDKSKGTCSCQFQKAFDKSHVSWTMLSASFGAIRPTAISKSNFYNIADTNLNSCS